MNWKAVVPLALDNLRRHRLFALAALFGIVCAVALLVVIVALSSGLREHVLERVFDSLPETHLKVSSGAMDLGFLNFAKPKFMKGATLGDELMREISERPGVQSVYGDLAIRFPVKATGSFLGREAATDLVGNGLEPSVVAGDLENPEDFVHQESGPVPVVISTQLLDLYNSSFAPMNNFPSLTQKALIGFRFDLILGRSYLGGKASKGRPRKVQCRVVGFSPKAINVGITVPMEYVRRWNREFAEEDRGYRALMVAVEHPQQVEPLRDWLTGRGFQVQTAQEGAGQQVGQALDLLTALAAGLAGLMMLLAAGNLAFLLFIMVQRRREEIGLWRTVGATRGEIAATILLEAAVLGLVGGLVGLALGVGAGELSQSLILERLAGLPFVPAALLAYPGWLWPLALLFALCATLLGALPPALLAARLDPLRALRR